MEREGDKAELDDTSHADWDKTGHVCKITHPNRYRGLFDRI